jgi:hypothetical protein
VVPEAPLETVSSGASLVSASGTTPGAESTLPISING